MGLSVWTAGPFQENGDKLVTRAVVWRQPTMANSESSPWVQNKENTTSRVSAVLTRQGLSGDLTADDASPLDT